jgi:hypothetical protein
MNAGAIAPYNAEFLNDEVDPRVLSAANDRLLDEP